MARATTDDNVIENRPIPSSQRHWLLERIICALRWFVLLIPLIPAYLASHYLLYLSGILWLPSAWRTPMTFMGTVLGLSVFQFIRTKFTRRMYGITIVSFLACIVLMILSFGLRDTSVHLWPGAQEWIRENLPSPLATNRSDTPSLKTAGADFINPERSEIFIPAEWLRPCELRHYLKLFASDPTNDGDPLVLVLDTDPDRIIDYLRAASGKRSILIQSVLFALLYLGIVTTFAAGLAFAFCREAISTALAAEGVGGIE